MKYFNVIIPTYNCETTLLRAVDSVRKQTFKNYNLIIVDDCSDDKTREIISTVVEADRVMLTEKRYNGGARNVGMSEAPASKYTLFLDADDEFAYDEFFQDLHEFIESVGEPDVIRLPYIKHYDQSRFNNRRTKFYKEEDIFDVIVSPKVAAWTKCVKTNLLVPFPENTLMEDVVQHLAQMDEATDVAWFQKAAVIWHINPRSTSHSNSPKWQSSAWRFVADLMDLDLKSGVARQRRDQKIELAKENLKNGKAEQ